MKARLSMNKLSLSMALMAAALSAAAVEQPTQIRGARALGMGDAFTAVADDQNVFFYNPAGSVQRTGSLATLLDIPVTLSEDFVRFGKFVSDNETDLKNFTSLPPARQAELANKINTTLVKLRPTFGLGLPNTSYLSGPTANHWHWGWGLFAQASGRLGFNPSVLVPSLYYDINADIVPMLNIAKGWDGALFLPGRLGLGVNVKYLRRGSASDPNVSVLQLDNYNSPPLQMGSGLGLDAGLLYRPTDRWNVGVTLMDAGGTQLDFDSLDAKDGFAAKPARVSGIRQRVNVGLAWTPARLGIGPIGIPTGDRLLLAVDFRDIANADSKTFFDGGVIADSAGKHIHLGAEYRWWFLRLRGGANQGYSTVGGGLDLPLLKLDYAYYSDEVGAFAGNLKHSAHTVSLALRFGTGSTEGRERLKHKPAEKASDHTTPAPAADEQAKPE